ncbi:MAG: flavodoxin FldA [Malacoplasma sp.]|nr:flavodoxin FldA [Malacoplasma sp.]
MKIAIVYGATLGNTERAAFDIQKEFDLENIDVLNISNTTAEKLNEYDKLIFGTSTWGLGDLQDDWDSFDFSKLKIDNKTVAIFGMGDSEVYAFTYCDSIAKLHKILKSKNANIVGYVSDKDYKYTKSESVVDGMFLGLALDNDNFEELTESRIKNWVNEIKKYFV